jgi:hypothetical protein
LIDVGWKDAQMQFHHPVHLNDGSTLKAVYPFCIFLICKSYIPHIYTYKLYISNMLLESLCFSASESRNFFAAMVLMGVSKISAPEPPQKRNEALQIKLLALETRIYFL